MRKWLIPAVMTLALTVPMGLSAHANPIFGSAKVKTIDNNTMKKVVGQNTTSAYYAYLGTYYSTVAQGYAAYGAYLEAFGDAYAGSRDSYYYNAYYYSYYATDAYWNAYYYN